MEADSKTLPGPHVASQLPTTHRTCVQEGTSVTNAPHQATCLPCRTPRCSLHLSGEALRLGKDSGCSQDPPSSQRSGPREGQLKEPNSSMVTPKQGLVLLPATLPCF